MNIYSVLSIMACMLYLFAGFHIWRSYKKTVIRRLVLLMCLSMSVWSFGYAFVYAEAPGSWMKVSAWGWCTFSGFVLHAAVRFADVRLFRKVIPQVLLYIPPVVFLYMSLFLFGAGLDPSKGVSDFFYTGDFLYDFLYLMAAIILVLRKRAGVQEKRGRTELSIIAVTSFVPFVLNLLTQFVLPAAGMEVVPPMGQIFALIMIGGICYSNTKSGLFGVPLHILYDEVLTEMMDLFFLLSPEGRIQRVNGRTVSLLGFTQEQLERMKLTDLCMEKTDLDIILFQNAAAHSPAHAEIHCMNQSGDYIPIRISCSHLKDSVTGELLSIMVMGQDITVKKRLEEEIRIQQEFERKLRNSEERFRAMFDKHSAIMCLVDPVTLRILAVNNAAMAFYGYSLPQFESMTMTELNSMSLQEVKTLASRVVNDRGALFHLKHRLANGDIRDVEVHSTAIPFGKRQVIYSIIHDITERKKAEDYISYLAYHDSLTGLSNRKRFYGLVEKALASAGQAGEGFAVLFIDMDDLKYINDTYGHEQGDNVLREFGRRMKTAAQDGDITARLGRDEFAMLLPRVRNVDEAALAADAISGALRKPIPIGSDAINVHASVGISLFPEDGTDVDALLKQADFNMYAMKREKKPAAHGDH
jgi:diguanylate cyclase (GGDEF)-like protein/PAS domain S-box-containing protein